MLNTAPLVDAVCAEIGIEPGFVRSMVVGRDFVEVEFFEANDAGSKFIRDDGFVATKRVQMDAWYGTPPSEG